MFFLVLITLIDRIHISTDRLLGHMLAALFVDRIFRCCLFIRDAHPCKLAFCWFGALALQVCVAVCLYVCVQGLALNFNIGSPSGLQQEPAAHEEVPARQQEERAEAL